MATMITWMPGFEIATVWTLLSPGWTTPAIAKSSSWIFTEMTMSAVGLSGSGGPAYGCTSTNVLGVGPAYSSATTNRLAGLGTFNWSPQSTRISNVSAPGSENVNVSVVAPVLALTSVAETGSSVGLTLFTVTSKEPVTLP